jgi:SAM-dependent methyltransferase
MSTTFSDLPRRSPDCGPAGGDVSAFGLTPPRDPLTERSLRTWSAGDYDRISAGFRHEAEAFVARRRLSPGFDVLDAACGTGNVAIPAARTGARVTGLDLVPALLAGAAAWAAREGVSLALREGDVEEMPFEDRSFDVVFSMFGSMFAARPGKTAAELARVTRPGGQVVLANWTPGGFVGRMFALHAAVLPPTGLPSPLQWGDPEVVRERLDDALWEVETATRTLVFRYPHTPAGTAELFRGAYGPTVRAFQALDENGRATLAASLEAHWSGGRAGAAVTEVESEYLEVVATRR